jgi:hypothetical protein
LVGLGPSIQRNAVLSELPQPSAFVEQLIMLPQRLEMRKMKANSRKMENEKGKLVLFSSFFDSD